MAKENETHIKLSHLLFLGDFKLGSKLTAIAKKVPISWIFPRNRFFFALKYDTI